MAVRLDCIDLIVPIATIEAKYPGGWAQCLDDHREAIGRRVWYDEHLFRDGAMSPFDMQLKLDEWAAIGFQLYGKRMGKRIWKDVCVVDGLADGPTLPCPWLQVDMAQQCALLVGQPHGDLIGPGEFHWQP